MRNKFAEVFSRVAEKNKKLCLIVSDISPGGPVNKFEKKIPKDLLIVVLQNNQ